MHINCEKHKLPKVDLVFVIMANRWAGGRDWVNRTRRGGRLNNLRKIKSLPANVECF